jgi:isopenicillin-N epimerase
VISWGDGQGLAAEFDWVGTRDFSPFLTAPVGIEFMQDMGVAAMRDYQRDLAWDAALRLSRGWNTELPFERSQVGSMVTVPLPQHAGTTAMDAHRLRLALLVEDRIEVQMHAFRGRLWARISAQVYNESADIERLATALSHRL